MWFGSVSTCVCAIQIGFQCCFWCSIFPKQNICIYMHKGKCLNECMSFLNARQYMHGYKFEEYNKVFGCLSSVLVTSGSFMGISSLFSRQFPYNVQFFVELLILHTTFNKNKKQAIGQGTQLLVFACEYRKSWVGSQHCINQAWWGRPLIPALRWYRQEAQTFKAVCYIKCLRPAWVTKDKTNPMLPKPRC